MSKEQWQSDFLQAASVDHNEIDGALAKVKSEGAHRQGVRRRFKAGAGALAVVTVAAGAFAFGSISPRPVVVTELANLAGVPVADNTTTTQAPTTTIAKTPVDPASQKFVISNDGVGVAKFGDPATEVIASMVAKFGRPTSDTGWFSLEDARSGNVMAYPGICNRKNEQSNRQRVVRWGMLSLGFTGEPTIFRNERMDHFVTVATMKFADQASDSVATNLETEKGVKVGDAWTKVVTAYGRQAKKEDSGGGRVFKQGRLTIQGEGLSSDATEAQITVGAVSSGGPTCGNPRD